MIQSTFVKALIALTVVAFQSCANAIMPPDVTPGASAASAASAASVRGPRCERDLDCQGGRICDREACVVRASRVTLASGSRHGTFETKVERTSIADKPSCRVSFRYASGQTDRLFTVPNCSGDSPGITMIFGPERVELPAGSGGEADEFHLFRIASSRKGAADPADVANDYWAVVLRPNTSWVTSLAVGSRPLEVAALTPTSTAWEEPATTTDGGYRYSVVFGALSKLTLPMVPSEVISQKKVVLVGELRPGTTENPRPSIDGTLIDSDGPCPLESLIEERTRVRLTAEVTTRSDGRTRVKCTAVEPEK